ncbi:BTB/POZ domain and ankyrin repeat-containing protein NOOT1 isoform X2 [Cryptomeria japonica]|uniref:BTB/POZ domain and ankyrin repeat-containing protein NOOT1 isoform X2 n=1 Tax=Cryptomeria japonica TaxID=3369 RepID=UPI0027D9FEC7|nr:BTB/POZ domain and ankyrin repeat-containing protein NOOT1 isoform X2 [Cryptomeria japonica]
MNPDDPLKSVSLDFLNLLINGQAFSDVIFSVEGRQVHAHKCILAARSPFFRMIFCNNEAMNERGDSSCAQVIPVGVVGYEVFMAVLQFLYSGQACIVPQKHQGRPNCREKGCWHTHCASAIDLALDTLSAANFFGVDQLSIITQLVSMVEKASIEDVTRVLMAARKQDLHYVWNTCYHLIARSGLPPEVLAKHLPVDVTTKIEEIRLKSNYGRAFHQVVPGNEVGSKGSMEDQRIRRMQRALDSSDVELVRLMVMGEGLNLDQALALHYAVANCSREVVKTLLELGAADVNHPGPGGRTALHIASEMVNPDMVAVLLDHHANPNVRTYSGTTPFDILQSLASDFLSRGGGISIPHFEHNKLRLCLELLQSAAQVLSRDEETSTSLQLQLETSAAAADHHHPHNNNNNNNNRATSSSSSSSVSAFAFTPGTSVMQQVQGHCEISEGSSHLAALDSTMLFLNLTGQLACKDTPHDINPSESPRGR